MGQLVNVLLSINKTHTVAQSAWTVDQALVLLIQVYGPNRPTPSV